MNNRYLKYRDFYIKNDLGSFLLFYDFFYELKVERYNFIDPVRLFLYYCQRFFLLSIFFLKILRLICKLVHLEEDFIIKKEGSGNFGSDLFLFKTSAGYEIKKKFFSPEVYRIYKKYYLSFYKNSSKIIFPETTFDDNGLMATVEFLALPSLMKLRTTGRLSFNKLVAIAGELNQELDKMYGSGELGLVHGDFSIINILPNKDKYYLIDYADAFEYKRKYDKYYLMKSILKHAGVESVGYDLMSKYLTLSQVEFKEYEDIYEERRQKKKK